MATADTSEDLPFAEMNTTPLIDVMLVLLIMFIITIPMQTHAVKIDLPGGLPPSIAAPDPVVNDLGIDTRGQVLWNGVAIDLATLGSYLDRTKVMIPEPELHVRPEPDARYETVDRVLAVIKRSGVTKMGFVGNDRYRSLGN